jgi:hypothetical protein
VLDLATAPAGEQICPFTAGLIVVVDRTVVVVARAVVVVARTVVAGGLATDDVGGMVVVVGAVVVLAVVATIVVRATVVVGFVGVPFAPEPQPASTMTNRTTAERCPPDRPLLPKNVTIVSPPSARDSVSTPRDRAASDTAARRTAASTDAHPRRCGEETPCSKPPSSDDARMNLPRVAEHTWAISVSTITSPAQLSCAW